MQCDFYADTYFMVDGSGKESGCQAEEEFGLCSASYIR